MKKRALITGVNGMDGSHLADFLLEKDALAHAYKMRDNGADIIDIGGESTRPNANYVDDKNNYTNLTVLHDDEGEPVYNASQPETWLQKRQSQLFQLDHGITCSIKTNGNSLTDCGDVVEFNLPAVATAKTEDNDKLDFFYRGRFLIKRIRQDFNLASKKHESIMTLVKDSLSKELESSGESLEFQPEDNDEIIENFYVKT